MLSSDPEDDGTITQRYITNYSHVSLNDWDMF